MILVHWLLALILLCALPSFALADHGSVRNDTFNALPDANTASFRTNSQIMWDHEEAQREGASHAPFVFSGGLHATSASLTSAAFATEAFVPERVNQVSTAITYIAAANDTCWTIISSDNNGIPGWTRAGTTAYYSLCEGDTTPNEPLLPPNSAWLMLLHITGSAITTVTDTRTRNPYLTTTDNTLGSTNLLQDIEQRLGAVLSSYIVSGCAPVVPAASLTFAGFACTSFVADASVPPRLRAVVQESRTVGPLNVGNGTYWLAQHQDRTSTVVGWTREAVTHYLWQFASDQPADPVEGQVFRQVTVAAGAITASLDRRVPRSYAQWRVYDITDPLFGATDDGLINDATAIQAAFNRGRRVYIPTGTYHVGTTTLTVPNQTIVFGDGPTRSMIVYAGTGDGIQINNPINSSTGAYITLKDFAVLCSGAPVTPGGCIADTGSTFLHIENVRVNGNWAGIIFDQTEVSTIKNAYIEASGTVGLWLTNGNARTPGALQGFTNQISVSNTQFNRVALANTFAIVDDGGAVHEFKNNNINGWGTWARLASQQNTKFTNNEWEGAIDAAPFTVNATTSVNGQAVAAGGVLVFDTNGFGNTATQTLINVIGAATQNRIVLLGNTMNNSSNPVVGGASNLSELVEIGNLRADGNFYTAPPAGGATPTSIDVRSGSWTPVGNGVTLTVTLAGYVRIGRQVTVQFDVTWPVTADAGQARIAGLPFPPMALWTTTCHALLTATTTAQDCYGDANPWIYLYTSGVGIRTNASMSTLRVAGSYTYFR